LQLYASQCYELPSKIYKIYILINLFVYSHTSDEQTTLESEKTTGKLGFYSLGLATNNYMYIAVGNPGF